MSSSFVLPLSAKLGNMLSLPTPSLSTPGLTDDDDLHSIASSAEEEYEVNESICTELYNPVFLDGGCIYNYTVGPKPHISGRPRFFVRTVAAGLHAAATVEGPAHDGMDGIRENDAKDASLPTDQDVQLPVGEGEFLPELHSDTQCEGAYCNFRIPPPRPLRNGGQAPGSDERFDLPELQPATCEGAYCDIAFPSKVASTQTVSSEDVQMPVDSPDASLSSQSLLEAQPATCEGAYCDIVIPSKDASTPSELSDSSAQDLQQAADPVWNTQSLLEAQPATCEGAYCDIVIPSKGISPLEDTQKPIQEADPGFSAKSLLETQPTTPTTCEGAYCDIVPSRSTVF